MLLRIILALSELALILLKAGREQRAIQEAEAAGAQETMELTHARLRAALAARTGPPSDPSGGVRDPDRYVRD